MLLPSEPKQYVYNSAGDYYTRQRETLPVELLCSLAGLEACVFLLDLSRPAEGLNQEGGMFRDKYGIEWMIEFDQKKPLV